MSIERTILFWATNRDEECLRYESIHDAVEMYWDGWPLDVVPPMPETVTVYGFARMVPTMRDCGKPLENLLEQLDETYGSPEDDGWTSATASMESAERMFIAAILAEYEPWACEVVEDRVVNVKEVLG